MSTEDKNEVVKQVVKETGWRHKITWTIQILGFAGIMWIGKELKGAFKVAQAINYAACNFPQHEEEDSIKYTKLTTKVDCLDYKVTLFLASKTK